MVLPLSYHMEVELLGAFGNLYRRRHVLVAPVDDENRVLLGEKEDFYPAGICRLAGGGVDAGEDFRAAATREMAEELNVVPAAGDLSHLADITVHAVTGAGDFTLLTRLFGCRLGAAPLRPGSDLSGIAWMAFGEIERLIERYGALPDDFWYDDGQGYRHRWGDYGKVYGPVHRCCLAAIQAWLAAAA